MATREASHAGSWYSSTARISPKSWTASWTPRGRTEAHPERSSYRTPGTHIPPTAAWGYKNVDAGAGVSACSSSARPTTCSSVDAR